MNKGKKIKILLISIIIILIVTILTVFLYSRNSKYKFDVIEVEKEIRENYKQLDLRTLDNFDVNLYFGLELDDNSSSLFLTDFTEDADNPTPFAPKHVIVLINTKEVDKYYESLDEFVSYHKMSTEDKKEIKLYDKAILEKGNNYIYLILGSERKDIEKTILKLKED